MKRALALMLGLSLLATPGLAEDFPTKPITLIIPYGPGGSADLTIRMIEDAVSRQLGQKLLLINKPGGAGVAGHFQLTKAAPDGYTLAIVGPGSTAVAPHTSKVGYERGDYTGVVQINTIPFLLVTPPNSPFKTMKDLVDFAKQNPPGRVKVGITARGSWLHLVMLQLEHVHGIKFTYIPHESSGGIVTSVMGGHIDLGNADPPSAQAKIQAGELRGLAIWSAKRVPGLPGVPTLIEQGTNLEASVYTCIIAPAGTPVAVIAKLEKAFKAAMEDPEIVKRATELGADFDYLGSKELNARLDQAFGMAGQTLKELGLTK